MKASSKFSGIAALFAALILVSLTVNANADASSPAFRRVQPSCEGACVAMREASPWLIKNIPGVSIVSVGRCDIRTGERVNLSFEPNLPQTPDEYKTDCIEVGLLKEADLTNVRRLYPTGLAFNNVLVAFYVSGELVPAPRVSGSN